MSIKSMMGITPIINFFNTRPYPTFRFVVRIVIRESNLKNIVNIQNSNIKAIIIGSMSCDTH